MVLTNFPYDPLLDLAPWVGQRQSTFRFDLINGVSGINKGEIHPIPPASLTHNTTSTIKRQLTITLGIEDTALIDPISDRVLVFMVFPNGQEYPLGRYVFTASTEQVFTSGNLSNMTLSDEMYLVDQQIEKGFTAKNTVQEAFFANGGAVSTTVVRLLKDLPVRLEIEASPFLTVQAWAAGVQRGQILEALAVQGDYFSPWFGNDAAMHMIRSFNPALVVPDFDWDAGNQVMRASISQTSNILNAPNRFIVVSNSSADESGPTFGVADVPVNAPHSIENRGFVIPQVEDLQALTKAQCGAIASNLVQRQTVFETATLTTAPDPRHDSYNVIHWLGEMWLELAWSMDLREGAPMSHTLRKAYR